MTTPDPFLLAELLEERFAVPMWWTAPVYYEPEDDEKRAWLRLRELKAAVDGDVLTSVLPDQNEEVA